MSTCSLYLAKPTCLFTSRFFSLSPRYASFVHVLLQIIAMVSSLSWLHNKIQPRSGYPKSLLLLLTMSCYHPMIDNWTRSMQMPCFLQRTVQIYTCPVYFCISTIFQLYLDYSSNVFTRNGLTKHAFKLSMQLIITKLFDIIVKSLNFIV